MNKSWLEDNHGADIPQPRRLASLDFLRGLAIILMTLMHTFEHLYDYKWVKEDAKRILNLPFPVLIIGIVIFFFIVYSIWSSS